MKPSARHLLAAVLFVTTFFSHLAFTDLNQEEIAGDENWYSYSAVYGLGSIVRGCRVFLGEDTRCGVRAEHPFLVEAFEHTWLDRYLDGEIDFETLAGRAQGLDVAKNASYGVYATFHVRTPADILSSLANFNAILLMFGIWFGGGTYKFYLLVQMLVVACAPVLVMELGRRFVDPSLFFRVPLLKTRLPVSLAAGFFAGGVWMLYGWTQMRGHMVAQPLATTLVTAAFLFLLHGLQRRRGFWLLLGCFCGGLAASLDIGLRPFLILPIPMLLIGWLLVSPRWSTQDADERRSLRRLALWPTLWIAGITLFVALLYPFRTLPVDTHTPITFRLHMSSMLIGSYPSTAQGKATHHRLDGWWLGPIYPELKDRTEIPQRLRDPLTNIEPISFYRIWTTPWRGYEIRDIPIPLILHRTIVLFGLLGLLVALGRRDSRGVVAWLMLSALGAFMLVHGLVVVEPRRALPWLPTLWTMGGPLFAAALLRTPKLRTVALLGGGLLSVVLQPAHLAVILPFLPVAALFALILLLRLLFLGWTMLWVIKTLQPSPWTPWLAAPAALFFVVFFCLGQSRGDWRVWSAPLPEGTALRQSVTLPDPLPWPEEESVWLLIDTYPDDRFELRIDGRTVKEGDRPLVRWQQERQRYTRIWRALPFPEDLLVPGRTIEVEVTGTAAKGKPLRLLGDFPSGDDDTFRGPSIEYQGVRRSIWRERWNAREEPRVPDSFPLRGVEYLSTAGDSSRDLSSDFGRQFGRYRLFVAGFDPAETPEAVTAPEAVTPLTENP